MVLSAWRADCKPHQSVIFVGQTGKVVPELVHKHVRRPETVGRNCGIEIEYASSPVRLAVHQNLDEFVRSIRRSIAQCTVLKGQYVTLRTEGGVAGTERRAVVDSSRRTRDT